MKQGIQHRNVIVRWSVIVILAADLILLGVNWRLNQSPHVQAGDLRRLDHGLQVAQALDLAVIQVRLQQVNAPFG